VKRNLFLLFLFIASFSAYAETVYVTDHFKIELRSGESIRNKIINMIPSGTPLTVISKNPSTGYSKVRLKNGMEGFILTRYTQDNPISKWKLQQAQEKLQFLQEENKTIKAELAQLKGTNTSALTENESLTLERDKLSTELNNLRQTAANSIQLKNQRDQLQERVITIERELQQLKLENKSLTDSRDQDWFLYGGILAFTGIFLGLIIPKIRWQRKTSNWDTF
jgi:SH3 domain protein